MYYYYFVFVVVVEGCRKLFIIYLPPPELPAAYPCHSELSIMYIYEVQSDYSEEFIIDKCHAHDGIGLWPFKYSTPLYTKRLGHLII